MMHEHRTARPPLSRLLIALGFAAAGCTAAPLPIDAALDRPDVGPDARDAASDAARSDASVTDAGPADAGMSDAGELDVDAGMDAGNDAGMDAGNDAGNDAGMDAGNDAGNDVCGDGALDPGEYCDDHNTSPGDGCASCLVEAGWTCAGAPSTCLEHRLTPTVDGVHEALWDGPAVSVYSASVGQARQPGDHVATIRVVSDATYLYVAVSGFVDPWDDGLSAHLHVYVTPDATSAGSISADDWMGSITFAAGSRRPYAVAHYWSQRASSGPYGIGGAADQGADDGVGFAELRIPLSSIGSPSPGAILGVLVGYRPDELKVGFSDLAPFRAGVVSDYGNTASAVDPAAADYIVHMVY